MKTFKYCDTNREHENASRSSTVYPESGRLKSGKRVVLTLLLVLLFQLPATSFATETGASFQWLKKINRTTYPYAHAVLASEIEHVEQLDDGSRSNSDDVYITVLDEEGKQNHEVLSFYLNKAYDRLEIISCEIIHDGRARPVDLKACRREETSSGNSRMNIYNPLEKTIKIFLPGLEVGDTIHYRINRHTFKMVIPDQFYGSILGQYDIPIRSYLFTITTPVDTRLNWLIKNEVKGCVAYRQVRLPGKDQKIIRRWHFRNVPMIVPEPEMPSFRRVAMRLLYSTLPDWQAISSWYSSLVEDKLKPSPELKEQISKLTSGKNEDREKIAALFYFVARKIRYLGVNGESRRPGFEPHDINLTFQRRHGVCRDKAALLVGMLRSAGFRAAPVLIRVGDRLDREIPLPYFNHAIVAILDKQGRTRLLLDPTSETSRQFLPDYERECSYLVADPLHNDLDLTPPLPPERNLFQVKISDRLDETGSLKGKIEVHCTGFNDTMMRSIMMNQSRRQRENFLKGFFLNQYCGLELSRIDWTDPADPQIPFGFSGEFSLPKALRGSGQGTNLLRPVTGMQNPGLLDRWILARADMTARRFPIKLGYTFTTTVEEKLTLPHPARKIVLPATIKIDTPEFTQVFATSTKPRELVFKRRLVIKKSEIATSAYPGLTEIQNRNLKLSRTPISITWQTKD
ncbi:MAG: DUF3857 domain-containing transglutaminase family protein [Deltaproteobacteria bacterium]|nr:DUF3857 domain-containing transglutaminase family protein [Deltaproteobacteria bacterium]